LKINQLYYLKQNNYA